MEKKIKTLYSLSIIAIIAFLTMQAYWLYGRYEYTLRAVEDEAESEIISALDEYLKIRAEKTDSTKRSFQCKSNFNIDNSPDEKGHMVRKITVESIRYNAYSLLGISKIRPLTKAEKEKIADMIPNHVDSVDSMAYTIEVRNSPSEGAVWSAVRNAELNWMTPFTTAGLDSVLKKKGINADIDLIVSDSIIWKPSVKRHESTLAPRMKVSAPYSELEKKSVVVTYDIPVSDTIEKMSSTLVFAIFISLLLIMSLIWQFSTIVKLNRLDNMRNKFITTMIHELKRPISTLKMCVSGIENESMMADNETKKELTSETRHALDNLSAYFSKLRDITFNKTDQIPLNVTSFNLKELVDAVVASLAIPSDKTVEFHNEINTSMIISADRSHFFNILTNLIENAIKYSDQKVEITAQAETESQNIRMTISDNGNGISKTDRNHIFSRFYRGKAAMGNQAGMGLGLSYVKLLAEAHGGRVEVRSTEGKGSDFTIILPQ